MTKEPLISWRTIATPLGPFTFAWNDNGLIEADFTDTPDMAKSYVDRKQLGKFDSQETQGSVYEVALTDYFAGDLHAIDDLDVAQIGTDFSCEVWNELCQISVGTTRTYGEVALRLDRPKAFRAVGMACNRNPVAVVVPCHRVVGQSGKLTGYAGGLHLKEWLLEHEGVATKADQYRLL